MRNTYLPYAISKPIINSLKYKIYWLLKPHCNDAKKILQVDGRFAYKCRHEV